MKNLEVKFSAKVASNIDAAVKLSDHFKAEYQKAEQTKNALFESVLLVASGLDSLDGYELGGVDLSKGEATLIKKV